MKKVEKRRTKNIDFLIERRYNEGNEKRENKKKKGGNRCEGRVERFFEISLST